MTVVLALGIGIGVAEATGTNLTGTAITQVVVHPTVAASGPVTWNDTAPHMLPGTMFTVTIPSGQTDFLRMSTPGQSAGTLYGTGTGINCEPGFAEFYPGYPYLTTAKGEAVSLYGADTYQPISPVLSAGTYRFGLSAICPSSYASATDSVEGGGYVEAEVVTSG